MVVPEACGDVVVVERTTVGDEGGGAGVGVGGAVIVNAALSLMSPAALVLPELSAAT